jgi:RNA polymerase-binding transcription factor DksA
VNESPDSGPSSADLAPPTTAAVEHEASLQSPDTHTTTSVAEQPASIDEATPVDAASAAPTIDLDAIERDLTDVQTALERLNDGSYWTDEVTGAPIADDVLAAHPTARTSTPTLN